MRYDDAEVVTALLEHFIREQFQVPADDPHFSRRVHLWDSGYVDSIGVAEVIAFLEATFDVTVPDEALFSPDFVHIEGIARIVCDLAAIAGPVVAPAGEYQMSVPSPPIEITCASDDARASEASECLDQSSSASGQPATPNHETCAQHVLDGAQPSEEEMDVRLCSHHQSTPRVLCLRAQS